MNAYPQSIEVGPVKVDTGNDWMDFGFILILIPVILFFYVVFRNRVK